MKTKILLFLMLNGLFATAQITSVQSGNWNSASTWDCSCIPALGNTVIIANGHTVTSTNNLDLLLNQNITVNAGGTLVLQNGNTNLVSSFTINGTLRLEGGTLNGSTINFNNGSTYQHARDGGTIPSATWQPNATCLITGVTNNMPTGFAGQNFGNLTWDCSNQSTYLAFNANFDIQETFRVQNSHNTSSLLGIAVSNSNTTDYTVTTKDFIMDNPAPNSAAFFPYAGSNSSRTGTLRVSRNVTMLNNTTTGVLSGVGKSQIELIGNNDATYSQNTSFSLYGTPGAVWEVLVNKTPGQKVTFTSPIGSIYWGPASGTPVSILRITNGIAEIDDNITLITSVVQGNATLRLKNNSSLQLINNNINFNNTFSGTLDAAPNSTVVFDNSVAQNIFSPSSGSFGNINITPNPSPRNLTSNITLTGNFTDVTGNLVHNNYRVTFAGASPQTISGNTEFYDININNNVSLTPSTNVRFKGLLSIANNKYLSLSDGNLIAVYGDGTSPFFNGGMNNYVVTDGTGVVKIRNESGVTLSFSLTIPMGYSTPTKYAGISFPISNLLDNQEFSLQVKQPGTYSYPTISATSRVDAVWQVTLPVGTTLSAPAQVYYTGSTVGGFTGGLAYYHNGTNWVSETTTSSNSSTTSFSPTSFSGGSRYYAVFSGATDYYTLGPGAVWNVNSNLWSNDGTTPCNCSPNGVSGANVRIRHNTTIPSGASVAANTEINIQNPVTLTSDIAFSVNELSGVSGARLRMNTNALPSVNTNNFATTPGTIVQFHLPSTNVIPNSFGGNPYKNLEISANAMLPSFQAVTIQENLTVHTGAILDLENANLSVGGSTTIEGTIRDAVTSGNSKFSGPVNITGTGSLVATGGLSNNSSFIFENHIVVNTSATFNLDCNCSFDFGFSAPLNITADAPMIFGANGSTVNTTFNQSTTFGGSSDITFSTTGNLIINAGVTVTNNAFEIKIYGNLNGTSASTSIWRQGNGVFTLRYFNSNKPMATGQFIANGNGNKVVYDNTANIIREAAYSTLEIVGNKQLAGNTIVDDFIGTSGVTLNLASFDLEVKGYWFGRTDPSSLNVINGKVVFNGSMLQQIYGKSDFDILEVANPVHVALNADNSANRILLTQGRLQLGNSVFTLKGTPASNQITQTFTNTSTSYIETNGTGNLTRNNLLAGTPYVFPIGDANAIRHFTLTLSSPASFVRGIFVPGVSPTPPPANTDIAAGRWLLQGADGATVSFHNSGATGSNSKVYRLDGTNWTDAGITTTFNLGVYTASPLDFSAAGTFTIFGQLVNHIVLESTFTQNQQPNGTILLYAETNFGLPAKFISTNTNVARVINNNTLVLTYNNADEFADILAFNEGTISIPPSDTIRVLRIYNFGYINQLQSDLDKKILLYPNPTADEIWISSLDNNLQVEKISIFNTLGQSVVAKITENKLSLVHLPAGVYVAEIRTSQGLIRRKITKR